MATKYSNEMNLSKLGLLFIVAVVPIAFSACSAMGWGLDKSDRNMTYRTLSVWETAGGIPLKEPHGLAIDKRNENVLISDVGNQRIVIFNQFGKYLFQFGKQGKGPGEFSHPMDVAVDSHGAIYVSDYFQDRIQKFSPDGKFLLEWGSSGANEKEFNAPIGLAIDLNDNIYVADFYNSSVKVYSSEGLYQRSIGSPGQFGEGKLDYPTDVAVNKEGKVIIADAYNYRIQKFDQSNASVSWGWHLFWFFPRPSTAENGFNVPTGISYGVNDTFIYVADGGNHRLVTLDQKGAFVNEWTLPNIDLEADPETYNSPVAVAEKQDGSAIYVVDNVNSRIYVLGIEHSKN